jgi:hypothetical protein
MVAISTRGIGERRNFPLHELRALTPSACSIAGQMDADSVFRQCPGVGESRAKSLSLLTSPAAPHSVAQPLHRNSSERATPPTRTHTNACVPLAAFFIPAWRKKGA